MTEGGPWGQSGTLAILQPSPSPPLVMMYHGSSNTGFTGGITLSISTSRMYNLFTSDLISSICESTNKRNSRWSICRKQPFPCIRPSCRFFSSFFHFHDAMIFFRGKFGICGETIEPIDSSCMVFPRIDRWATVVRTRGVLHTLHRISNGFSKFVYCWLLIITSLRRGPCSLLIYLDLAEIVAH